MEPRALDAQACQDSSVLPMWFRGAPACRKIDEEPTSRELGPRGCAEVVENGQRLKLVRYLWPVERPSGTVFCVHGYGGYTGSMLLKKQRPGEMGEYENSIVALLNGRGYSVACMDLQGCGRSEGFHDRRAFFYEFDDLVRDVSEFVRSVFEEKREGFSTERPIFLFGASMGGCLAVHVAEACKGMFAGVALLAPMLSVDQISRSGINRLYSVIAGWLNYLIPDVPLVGVKGVPKFPEIQAFWNQDTAIFKGRVCVRVCYQFIKAIEWIQQRTEKLVFPFIIIHGTEDTLCDPEGSKKFFESAVSVDKTLHMAENMWHLLTAEPGHEKVLETVIQWFDQRSLPEEN